MAKQSFKSLFGFINIDLNDDTYSRKKLIFNENIEKNYEKIIYSK